MKPFTLLALLAWLVSGCATIMNEDMVSIPVYTTPPGARVTINGMDYTSPATVTAPRGKGDYKLHVSKDGFEPVDVLLVESADAWLWGNILFGGLIGLAVDFISGDAHDFEPEVVSLDLIPKGSAAPAPAAPAVVP